MRAESKCKRLLQSPSQKTLNFVYNVIQNHVNLYLNASIALPSHQLRRYLRPWRELGCSLSKSPHNHICRFQ
jgi:hypothetical protein